MSLVTPAPFPHTLEVTSTPLLVFFADGVTLGKDDGVNVTNWGIVAPTKAPGVEAGAALSGTGPNGTYTWQYTYKNSKTQHQSNPSPASNSLTLAFQAANLPAIPAPADSQVDRVVWYRQGGAIADYEYVIEVAINTPATDTVGDLSLLNIVETDNDPPSPLSVIWEHLNCIFGIIAGAPEQIGWSKRWRPESFPLANTLIVTNRGEPLRAGLSWNGLGYVWSNKRLFRLLAAEQTDPTTGETLLVISSTVVEGAPGTASPRSITATAAGIVYRARDGLYLFDGSAATRLSDPADPLFHGEAIASYQPLASRVADQGAERATAHRGEYWLSHPIVMNGPNEQTLVWDLLRKRLRTILPFGFDALFGEWDCDIQGAMADQGVYLVELATNDAGQPIAVDVETSFQPMDGGRERPVQALCIEADAGGATLTITVARDGLDPSVPAAPSVSAVFGPGRTRRFFKVQGVAQAAAIEISGSVNDFILYRCLLSDDIIELKRYMDREQ